MRSSARAIFLFNVLAGLYGLYAELAPAGWPLRQLPQGMGLGLALIAATMAFTVAVVEKERQERITEGKLGTIWDQFAHRFSFCLPVHEREFYSLFRMQIATAQNNVDITHLGPRPPTNYQHVFEEQNYYTELRKICTASKAHIRRVERLTREKIPWIRKLAQEFEGVTNFSLRVYRDPFDTEMPAALSVSRVDDRYAWIVAMGEHESTGNYRDLLLTGHDGVDMVKRYFQERLWNPAKEIMAHGILKDGWEKELSI